MSFIINIDTATEIATVSLAADGILLQSISNENQKDHAAFLQPAIKQLLINNQLKTNQLSAVAVVNGPGSYTGLRVGMASAKGLCYALKKPLITVGTLEFMAASAIDQLPENKQGTLFCPMIDARRMEVFTALYSWEMEVIISPSALILDEHSFTDELAQHPIVFFGNGSDKFMTMTQHTNAIFKSIKADVNILCRMTSIMATTKHFTPLAYSEPLYVKAFYSTQKGQ